MSLPFSLGIAIASGVPPFCPAGLGHHCRDSLSVSGRLICHVLFLASIVAAGTGKAQPAQVVGRSCVTRRGRRPVAVDRHGASGGTSPTPPRSGGLVKQNAEPSLGWSCQRQLAKPQAGFVSRARQHFLKTRELHAPFPALFVFVCKAHQVDGRRVVDRRDLITDVEVYSRCASVSNPPGRSVAWL